MKKTLLVLILNFFFVQFCSGQLIKKEFLKTVKDSLTSDSWRICNIDNSFLKKDTIYLFKRVLNAKNEEEVNKQYNNCCKFITWNFINQNSLNVYEQERCGGEFIEVKSISISSENFKLKVIEKNNKTILKRFWRKKLVDSFYITEIKNVLFNENQKSIEIKLVKIK